MTQKTITPPQPRVNILPLDVSKGWAGPVTCSIGTESTGGTLDFSFWLYSSTAAVSNQVKIEFEFDQDGYSMTTVPMVEGTKVRLEGKSSGNVDSTDSIGMSDIQLSQASGHWVMLIDTSGLALKYRVYGTIRFRYSA